MARVLKNNSYHILGLDTSASQKDILKRSKEIINRLKIDDLPEYDLDSDVFGDFRTEGSVKEAVQRLSAPKKRIREYFFWFQLSDNIDEQAGGLIASKNEPKAIRVWEHNSEKNTTKTLLYKKNLAILYCLLLFKESNKKYLKRSLELWKELIDSDKFWSFFAKTYKLHDELGTSQAIIDSFKNDATSHVADIYTEIGDVHKDNSYIAESSKVLGTKGAATERIVLNPIYQSVIEVVEELESLNVSADGVIDEKESQTIKDLIGKLQENFNELIDLGLYDDSQSKTIRDRASNAIRTVVLDLQNNLSETDKALELMNIALKISGTASLEIKVKHEIRVLKEIKKNAGSVQPIADLIADEKCEEALEIIESDRKKHKSNTELQEFYDSQKKLCIVTIATKKFKQAHTYFDKKEEDLARSLFDEAGAMIYDNIDLFSFDKKAIDEIVEEIKTNIANVSRENWDQFEEYRNSYIQLAKDKFEGQLEHTALIILIDANIYGGLAGFVKGIRHKSHTAYIAYAVGFFLVFWIWWLGLIVLVGTWIYSKSKD